MGHERRRPLKVGAFIPIVETEMDGGSPRWADVLAMVRAAEAAGFDSVWLAQPGTAGQDGGYCR